MALNIPHLVGIRVAAIRQRMPVCAVVIVSVLVPSTFARAYAAVAAFVVLLKLGGRFCRNAENASFASSERTCALNSAFSARIASPADNGTLAQFVTVAVNAGQYDQAISSIEQYLIKYPRDARARLAASRLYYHVVS